MTRQLTARRRDERGFTLTEVMVVVLIVGILLVIAVPTFLGARSRAQDSAAKSSLRATQTAASVIYTDNETYKDATAKNLAAAEGSVTFVNSPKASTKPERVSVAASSNFGAAALSKSGKCFFVYMQAGGKTLYGSQDTKSCEGAAAEKYAKGSEY